MYSNKLAVAIKANNRVLRENGEQVYLPFGSEYTFLIKNLHTRRALVKIEIDGTEVTGGGLVVNANSSVDLERFITNGNLEQGNRFKFIERTAKIEQHRGVGLEDGLVRVEFEFEKERQILNIPPIYFNDWQTNAVADTWLSNPAFGSYTAKSMSDSTFMNCTSGMVGSTTLSATASASSAMNDVGITVPGSVSDQKFITTTIITDGVKHVMVLKLLGETENGKIEQPVTVKSKPKCTTCNHQNKANAKFCSECGTGLTIV